MLPEEERLSSFTNQSAFSSFYGVVKCFCVYTSFPFKLITETLLKNKESPGWHMAN